MSLRGCWGKECTGTRCQEQARPTRPVCGDGGAGGLSDVGRQGSSKAPQQDHVGRPWLEGMDAPSQHAGEQAPGPTGCRQMMTPPANHGHRQRLQLLPRARGHPAAARGRTRPCSAASEGRQLHFQSPLIESGPASIIYTFF